jgi:large subunit ribosomal protein L18
MDKQIAKRAGLARRHRRVRKKVTGSTARPRLAVYRANSNIYAQVVDDTTGKTLVAASTLDGDAKKAAQGAGKVAAAKAVGELVAKRALAADIKGVVFDRGGNLYHGRVKALAEGAREAGLSL